MSRWIAVLCVLTGLCLTPLARSQEQTAPTTAPAQVEADSSTPKGTLTLLSRATTSGDTSSVRGLLHANTPEEKKMADVLMERTEVYAKFRQAAVKSFGEDAADQLTGNTAAEAAEAEKRIQSATVKIDDNKASVQMEGQEDTVQLVKDDGKWKLSLAALTEGMGAGDVNEKLDQIRSFSEVVRETTSEIDQGKFKSPDEVNDAIRGKLTAMMMKNAVPATQPGEMPATQPAQ